MKNGVHARIQRVLSEGVQLNSDNPFLFVLLFSFLDDEGREGVDDGPTLNAGLVAL